MPASSLKNQLLIPTPQPTDDEFSGNIVLVCQHNNDGAFGVKLNEPLDTLPLEVFAELNIQSDVPPNYHRPLFSGGPVRSEVGLVLHDDPPENWQSTLAIGETIQLSSSIDILSAIAQGKGPENSIICFGYAGWGSGQLEDELKENFWITLEASHEFVFSVASELKFQTAIDRLGFNLNAYSPQVGNA